MSLLNHVSDEDLRRELEKRAEGKRKAEKPRPLESPDWSILIDTCVGHVEQIDRDGWLNEDRRYYIYESVMEAVYGSDVFTWINKRTNK